MTKRFWLSALAALVLIALGLFFFVVPREVDRRMNGVAMPPGYEATPAARTLHGRLFVADQDMTNSFLLKQSVINVQHGTAGIAEDILDLFFLQAPDYNFGSGKHHRKLARQVV